MDQRWKKNFFKWTFSQDTWVAQLNKCLTLGFCTGHDLRVLRLSTELGSEVCRGGLGFSLPLSLCPSPPPLSQINKSFLKNETSLLISKNYTKKCLSQVHSILCTSFFIYGDSLGKGDLQIAQTADPRGGDTPQTSLFKDVNFITLLSSIIFFC